MNTRAGVLQTLCPHCGTINRIEQSRLGQKPNCGRCHKALFTGSHQIRGMRRQSSRRRMRSTSFPLPPVRAARPSPASNGLAPPARNQNMLGVVHTEVSDSSKGAQKI